MEELMKEVYDELGPGYSERVYHNAVEVMLRERHIPYESERHILVRFRGHVVGQLRADIIVDDEIVLEFKTIKTLTDGSELQAHRYLDLTGLKTAYMVNFPPQPGRQVEIRKIVSAPLEGELSKAFDKIYDHHCNVSVGLSPLRTDTREPSSNDA